MIVTFLEVIKAQLSIIREQLPIIVEGYYLGTYQRVKNNLYQGQKRPKQFLVADIYPKASPAKFHPPRPSAWPFFTAFSNSVP